VIDVLLKVGIVFSSIVIFVCFYILIRGNIKLTLLVYYLYKHDFKKWWKENVRFFR
jgi:uncharacterized membrane protein